MTDGQLDAIRSALRLAAIDLSVMVGIMRDVENRAAEAQRRAPDTTAADEVLSRRGRLLELLEELS